MIRANGLTLRRGTKVLLDGAEFVVNPGDRVGIVGKNGAGIRLSGRREFRE